MTNLIINLSTGKGTWQHVSKVINQEKWDKVYIITNTFGKEKFSTKENQELIVIDDNKEVLELRDYIISQLKGKINDTEVGLNFYSGSGKEHMAILSAVLKLGLGPRIVIPSNTSIEDI